MSRAAVYELITELEPLHLLGYPATEVYRTTGMENTQANKYIVLRWGEQTPGVGSSDPELLTVWVYDKMGSYADIDLAVGVIKKALQDVVQMAGSDGHTLTQAKWLSTSSDLYDDMLKRITRNAVFTVNSRVS